MRHIIQPFLLTFFSGVLLYWHDKPRFLFIAQSVAPLLSTTLKRALYPPLTSPPLLPCLLLDIATEGDCEMYARLLFEPSLSYYYPTVVVSLPFCTFQIISDVLGCLFPPRPPLCHSSVISRSRSVFVSLDNFCRTGRADEGQDSLPFQEGGGGEADGAHRSGLLAGHAAGRPRWLHIHQRGLPFVALTHFYSVQYEY